MDYLIVLPVIKYPFLVARCISKLPKDKLLIIDNSQESFCKQFYKYDVEYHPENLGVGASWNVGLKRGHDYTIFLSASMDVKGSLNDWLSKASEYGLYSNHFWHLVAIGKKTVEKIGYIDENFYPAYYEDNDYKRRMELASIYLPKCEIEASSAGNAMSKKAGVPLNIPACQEYYIKKWGALPPNETYLTPFNL